jgi:hypothetical protein
VNDYIDKDKFTKESVNYSLGYKPAHCGICQHFLRPSACELVAGQIDPKYWCKKFKKHAGL